MQKFKVKILVRSIDDPAEFLNTEMQVQSTDLITAFTPFKVAAEKMRPRKDKDVD